MAGKYAAPGLKQRAIEWHIYSLIDFNRHSPAMTRENVSTICL